MTIVADGRELRVSADSSVAAALLNVGTHAFRSSVTGEARGPLCGMGVCHECRVTIDDVPHQRACLTRVADGMRVGGSAGGQAIAEMLADVAVIGAGPAGIAAATCAAESGRTVVLLDESPEVGGQIWRHTNRATLPVGARQWIARLERSGATIVTGASVASVASVAPLGGFVITAERGGAPCLVRATAVILATGARERFLPFPGWTLPGVIGVGGAQALLKAGASFAAKRVVIAGTGPLLLPVAAALTAAGANVLLVAEQAARAAVTRFALGLWRRPATLVQAARYRAGFLKAPYTPGLWVSAARGHDQLEEITVTDGHGSRTIACDLLCTGFGLVPNTELARLVGCATTSDGVTVDERQQTTIDGVYCVGESTGIGGVELSLVEGEIAGLAASGGDDANTHRPIARDLQRRRTSLRAVAVQMEQAFAPRGELRGLVTPETIVCRCEDVTASALSPDWTPRQAKLYSRAGMGPCQGRICGAALQFLHGWPPDVVRLPSQPVLLSTLLADAAPDAGARPHHGP